jgi:hypothetical protein
MMQNKESLITRFFGLYSKTELFILFACDLEIGITTHKINARRRHIRIVVSCVAFLGNDSLHRS